jgi:tetratricopeptide (TPR) repeat protein
MNADTGALVGAARLMSQVKDQRLDEALSYYNTAIQLQPDPNKGRKAAKAARNNLFNRANLYMKMERFEEARDGFEAAIAIDPKFSQAMANLGVALKQLGKEELSRDSFEKAKSINPDHVMIETRETDISGQSVTTGQT